MLLITFLLNAQQKCIDTSLFSPFHFPWKNLWALRDLRKLSTDVGRRKVSVKVNKINRGIWIFAAVT